MSCVQSYLLAYFPVQSWDKHKKWLRTYITEVGKLKKSHESKVIPYLYDDEKKAPREGSKPTWIKDWPYRPLQTEAKNCYMRNHNVGYRIRLGSNLYKWVRQQSASSFLLQTKFIERTPLSHWDVLQRFIKQLRVKQNEVYKGIAAEQAIVRYAGITRTQKGAMFRRDSNTNHTWFKLCLTSDESELFLNHYQTLHPDAIKKRETLGNDWVRIAFDTGRLYDEIIPKLV